LAKKGLSIEIDQLKEERWQLEDKISKIQNSAEVQSFSQFDQVFRATKLMRQTQDNKAQLKEKETEQKILLADTKHRETELKHQVTAVRNVTLKNESAQEIMSRLERKMADISSLRSQMVLQKSRLTDRIEEIENGPLKSPDDLKQLLEQVGSTERHLDELKMRKNPDLDKSKKESLGLLKKVI